MSASEQARRVAAIAWQAAAAKHADDLVAIDVSGCLPLTDIFLLASGRNEPQLSAIAKNIEQQLAGAQRQPTRIEGHRDGDWLLLDYGDLVVHLFRAAAREHYSLERLWKDCPTMALAADADHDAVSAGGQS